MDITNMVAWVLKELKMATALGNKQNLLYTLEF